MSVNKTGGFRYGNPVAKTPPTWTRPGDWLTLPTLVAGDQKIVGLYFVGPNDASNKIAFTITGAYTVDWGDGTTSNYASGVKGEKVLAWANYSAGTLTSDGFRQAVITITPQAGNSLISLVLNSIPTGQTSYVPQWREVSVVSSTLNSILTSFPILNQLAIFNYVGPSSIGSLLDCFRSSSIRYVTGTQWTSNVTNFAQAFQSAALLQSVPLFETSATTSFLSTFNGCVSLSNIPLFNTSNVTNFTSMFGACSSLTSVPLFDTSKGAALTSMFSGCTALLSVPNFNTILATDLGSMFASCANLKIAPVLNTSNAINTTSMFQNCTSLTAYPTYDLSKAATTANMFGACSAARGTATYNLAACTNAGGMFTANGSMEGIVLSNSNLVAAFVNGLTGATALRSASIDLSGIPTASQMQNVGVSPATSSAILTGLKFAMSFAGANLSAAAMNALYTSLGTASGAQTLTMTGNPGSGSSTVSIATAKGWTVVGG